MAALEAGDAREVLFRFAAELPERADRIARQTVNRGITRARTRMQRIIRDEVTLRQGYVLENLRIAPASEARPEAKLSSPGKDVLLARYGIRSQSLARFVGKKPAEGIPVDVGTRQGRKYLRHAFVIVKNGVELIVTRRRAAAGARAKLRARYGPSVDQIFDTVRDEVADDAQQWATAEMQRRIQVELNT